MQEIDDSRLSAMPSAARARLKELHAEASFRGVIPAAEASALADSIGAGLPELMGLLLPLATGYARPPVSRFHVGAIARGSSTGNLYYGANMEFAGESLGLSLHAEQSAIANAHAHGEQGIDAIAVTAAPCGLCRQFMNELAATDSISIYLPTGKRTLRGLLPEAFGPEDLTIGCRLMQHPEQNLEIEAGDELARLALSAARRSYAPYSGSFAGVAVRDVEGRTAAGSYLENAAFNPSLAPAVAALSQLNLAGGMTGEVTEVVLVHVDERHHAETRVVIGSVCDAVIRFVAARNSPDLHDR